MKNGFGIVAGIVLSTLLSACGGGGGVNNNGSVGIDGRWTALGEFCGDQAYGQQGNYGYQGGYQNSNVPLIYMDIGSIEIPVATISISGASITYEGETQVYQGYANSYTRQDFNGSVYRQSGDRVIFSVDRAVSVNVINGQAQTNPFQSQNQQSINQSQAFRVVQSGNRLDLVIQEPVNYQNNGYPNNAPQQYGYCNNNQALSIRFVRQ